MSDERGRVETTEAQVASWQRWRPSNVLARMLDITPGQATTALAAIALSLVMTLGGVPSVLRARDAGSAVPLDPASAEVGHDPSEAAAAAPASAPDDDLTSLAAPRGSATAGAPSAAPSNGRPAARAPSDEPSRHTMPDGNPPTRPPSLRSGEIARFASVPRPGAPHGIAVAADGTVYVATNNGTQQGVAGPSKILSFDERGELGRSYTITGQPEHHALGLTGLAVAGDGTLLAVDAATDRILQISMTSGRQSTVGKLVDVPACALVVAAPSECEPGVQDRAPEPRAIALGDDGTIYVADGAQGIVWRLRSGEPAERWLADEVFASGDGLAGIAFAGDGSMLVTSPQSLDPAAALGGALYRVGIEADGAAGTAQLVARFLPGDGPAGVAPLADGSAAVVLRGADAVAIVAPDGEETKRVTSGTGDEAFDKPTGIVFHGDTALVTNQAPSDENAWAILAVGLHDVARTVENGAPPA